MVMTVCDFRAVNGCLFCLQCACTESHRCMKLEKNKDAQGKVQGHQPWMEAKLLTKTRHSWQIPSLLPTPPLPPTYPPHLAKPHWDDDSWARQDLPVVAWSVNSRIFLCVGRGNQNPDPACCNVLKTNNNNNNKSEEKNVLNLDSINIFKSKLFALWSKGEKISSLHNNNNK